MKIYLSILLLFSCQILHTLALNCQKVRGKLKQIDAGSGLVVGVNKKNHVFILIDKSFRRLGRHVKHISVGPAGLLAVSKANHIFRFQGGKFVQLSGALKQVDAGGDQIVAGVNNNDNIYCLNMDTSNKWPSNSLPWVQIPGGLKYYSCGPYSCWGVSKNDQIWLKQHVSSNACSGVGNFINIPGSLSMIEVATDGSVFGVNSGGKLYQRTGVTRFNPSGTTWQSMTVCYKGHKHVSYDLGLLWVVCADGSVRKCTL